MGQAGSANIGVCREAQVSPGAQAMTACLILNVTLFALALLVGAVLIVERMDE